MAVSLGDALNLVARMIILLFLIFALYQVLGMKKLFQDWHAIHRPGTRAALISRWEKEVDELRRGKLFGKFIDKGEYLSIIYFEALREFNAPDPEKMMIAEKQIFLCDELLSLVRADKDLKKYENIVTRKAEALNEIGEIRRDMKVQLRSRQIYLDGLRALDSVEDRKKHRHFLGLIAEQDFRIAYSSKDERYFLEAVDLLKQRISYYNRTTEQNYIAQIYSELAKKYGEFSKLWNRQQYLEEMQRLVAEALQLPDLKRKHPEAYSEVLVVAGDARYYMSNFKREKGTSAAKP